MVSYSRDPAMKDNLALRATFPSASVFKVVTAAAAIGERQFSPETVIQFNGANHTLYKSNILKNNSSRWSRNSTLKDAFSKSINTVFGRLGAYTVGSAKLKDYADRFGFNRKIQSDLPMQEGSAPISADADAWGLAQTASGYTRDNTMSPMQGALIAAAVANDGLMMEPFVVQSVYTPEGVALYGAEPRVSNVAVDSRTAFEVRELMNETIMTGTSRKSFRGFFHGDLKNLDVGGKTGSLTGMDPPGKYDWFVGYAGGGAHRIAVAALTIHEKQWRVKSSYLARKAFERYFKDHPINERSLADNLRREQAALATAAK
jgi:cell division protein FtsI/penicillin-binding protein 2